MALVSKSDTGRVVWTYDDTPSAPVTDGVQPSDLVYDSSANNLYFMDGTRALVLLSGTKDLEISSPASAVGHSYQPLSIDFTVGGTAGSSTGGNPKYIATAMFNVFDAGATLATKNYVAAVIGAYSITSTNGTSFPKGAVLGQISDGVSDTAVGAFVAYIDGDDSQTKAGAAFKVWAPNNSTAGSGFDYGVDMFMALHDSFIALAMNVADIRFSSGGLFYTTTGAITANSTTTSLAAGTLGKTTNATGRASLFVSDGTKWQFLTNA